MELEFFGGNCFRIKTKQATIVLDDTLVACGKKSILNDKTAAFYTQVALIDKKNVAAAKLSITTPGEYEVGDVTVRGIAARSHLDEAQKHSATVYQFMHNGQTVSFVGHIHPDITDNVLELISGSDVLVVPVGGNGFTLDAVAAAQIVKKTEPSIVVPSQYEIEGFTYEVPAQALEEFAKVSSLNLEDERDVLKVAKSTDDSASQTHVIVLRVK